MTGWRRAFCTSIRKEKETIVLKDQKQQQHCDNNNSSSLSPRMSSRFGFFSNSSTPRLQSQPVSSPSLRCRTTQTSSVPSSPKLHCNTDLSTPKKNDSSPRLFQLSNPSSPKSPSSFPLLKVSLRLSKSRCGVCLQSVKSGQGTAIFTAECSHSFHFHCISAHVKKSQILSCPVCSSTWNEAPFLPIQTTHKLQMQSDNNNPKNTSNLGRDRDPKSKPLRVYDDDEPLMSPTSRARFIPIPESNENEDDEQQNENVQFQGFFTGAVTLSSPRIYNPVQNIELSLSSEAAVVSVGRSSRTYAVVLKVKAPVMNPTRRAPIDLVTVLDVSASSNKTKHQTIKRAMRLIISSLSCTDRLSIVAFSGTSKRLLALRRMTTNGRRSARRIVDALCEVGQGACVNDALKKAAKVIEDRRERNPVAAILLLSDDQNERAMGPTYRAYNQKLSSSSVFVSSTRFSSHMDIPVHAIGFGNDNAPPEDVLGKCVGGLLSAVVHDLKLQLGFSSGSSSAEIAAVYSLAGWPYVLGSGSVRVGDMYFEEERELLVELKMPVFSNGSYHVLSVRPTYKDPLSQELVLCEEQGLPVPNPFTVRSTTPDIEWLRNLHVTTRAVAESRRLLEYNDLSGAHRLLSSARALLMQKSTSATAGEYLSGLEAELAELSRRRQQQLQNQRRGSNGRERNRVDEKIEPFTPTSAWRAAERLAKVAIMRKSMNRVSDLHGFENARF